MNLKFEKLGKYIKQSNLKNNDGILGKENLVGISIDKEYMPSVANVEGTDLSKYKVLEKNYFSCNLMHVGRDEKLPIALYKNDYKSIVSPAYCVFKIVDETILLPEYLMLFFMREEFDHYCWFKSDSSVRGSISWSDLTEIEIPYIDIDKQRKIVSQYNSLTKKIDYNNNKIESINNFLELLFDNLYYKKNLLFSTNEDIYSNWESGTLSDIVTFINGVSFNSEDLLPSMEDETYAVFKMGNIRRGGGFLPENTKSWVKKDFCNKYKSKILKKGDILMAMTDMKDNVALLGHTAIMPENEKYIVNQRVGLLRKKNNFDFQFIYLLTNSYPFISDLRSRANRGVQVNLSKDAINDSKIEIPSKEFLKYFDKITQPLFELQFNLERQNETISHFKDVFIKGLFNRGD